MKKRLLIVAAAAAALIITAALIISAVCAIVPDRAEKGGSIVNIANGGMAVTDRMSGTVYYSNNGIYAKPADGDAYEVTDARAKSLAIADGVLYFCNMSDNNRCYAIDLESGEMKKINDELSVEYINIEDGKLYFACNREIDKAGIYSMNTDGSGLSFISDAYCASMMLYKDQFYFTNKWDDGKLYRVNKQGRAVTKLTDKRVSCAVINTQDNHIYYSDAEGIFRCDTNGRYTEKLADINATALAFDDENELIYSRYDYSEEAEDVGIYRLKDGLCERIRDDEAMWLAVCSDKLYFKSLTQGFAVMRCDFDGKNGVYIAGNEGSSMLAE